MENIYEIMISGLIISLVSIVGLLIIKSHVGVARFIEKNLLIFTSVSAGVFLVTSFILMRETLEILPLVNALIAFAGGIVLYIILHKTLSPHRHKGGDHTHVHDDKKPAWKILIGDTIHNIADGLLLVASFGAGSVVGFSTALSIALHEVPQEISEFLVLKKSGYTNREALYRNFATALSIFIGIVIGLFLINTEILQAYLLGITATFFAGIVFTDLFPVRNLLQHKQLGRMSGALLIGVVLMAGISSALGHSHEHGHEHHHEDDDHHEDEQEIHSEYHGIHEEIHEDEDHHEHETHHNH